jgi:hypothetical protein
MHKIVYLAITYPFFLCIFFIFHGARSRGGEGEGAGGGHGDGEGEAEGEAGEGEGVLKAFLFFFLSSTR